MRAKILLAVALCLGLGAGAPAQLASPYSNSVYPSQIFTATGQTGAIIQLNGLQVSSTVGSSFASGTITVTGSSLTTVTFSVWGSSDNGATYFALPIYTVASPSTSPTTVMTATANGLYQINLAGLTHIKFVTSGTFTATNVNIVLTASPNALISRSNTGGGSGLNQLTGDVTAGPGTGSQIATLPSVNSNVGSCGDATHVGQVTLDAKGRTTGCTPVSITAAVGAVANNLLVNSPTTGPFFCVEDSLGLPWTSDSCQQIQSGLGITALAGATIGSGTGADMASCATAGVGSCTQGGTTLPLTFPRGVAANSKTMLQIYGANDLSEMGSTPSNTQLSYFAGGLKAESLFFGVPDSQKIAANNTKYCTTSGTWTAAPSNLPGGVGTFPSGSLQTSSNGASISCTLQNATDAGFIAIKNVSSSATFTVTVTNPGSSGSPFSVADPYTGSTTLNETAAYTSAWGAVTDFYAVGYPNGSSAQAAMSGGYTTVTLTSTSSNALYVVGPYFIGPSAGNQDYPAVVLAEETYYGCNDTCQTLESPGLHGDSNVNVMRAAQVQVANELRNNGLNVSYFNPNATPTGYNSSDPAQTSRVSTLTVSAGGSSYTSPPTVTVTGCTIAPTFAVTISGGAVVTGNYNASTSGACLGGTPSVAFSGGGGTGAAGTAAVVSDGVHPDFLGGTNYAAAAIPSFNSAATSADHYIPSLSSGDCTNNCTFTGITNFNAGGGTFAQNLFGNPNVALKLDSTAGGGDVWSVLSLQTGKKLIFWDFTNSVFAWAMDAASVSGPGHIESPVWMVDCWSPTNDVTTTACDTGLSRGAAATVNIGNGSPGDTSGTLHATGIHNPNGKLIVDSGTQPEPVQFTSSAASNFIEVTGSGTNVADWIFGSAGNSTTAGGNAYMWAIVGSQYAAKMTTDKFVVPGGNVWGWAAAGVDVTAVDTGLSRDSAGAVDVGNGTQGDKSGALNAANVNVGGGATIVYICTGGAFSGLLATSSAACTGGTGTATGLHIN